jgi:pSer/pThr/pTyr-binding forkhead associated (FHA) protein
MPAVTFQVLEGIDKGRTFRELATPVTIGREEGNVLRLNDERVSRFHAKVQFDNGEIILTDLESTNGTRVNGNVVQIRRLRAGDRIHVGRSLLLFGSEQEIVDRATSPTGVTTSAADGLLTSYLPPNPNTRTLNASAEEDFDFDLSVNDKVTVSNGNLFINNRPLPPLPQRMTPSQAARLAELLEFLHKHVTLATENIRASDDLAQVTLAYADWQRLLAIQMVLARYCRAVAEPDALLE